VMELPAAVEPIIGDSLENLLCGLPQLQHVGDCSRVLGQTLAVWFPAHFIHRGG